MLNLGSDQHCLLTQERGCRPILVNACSSRFPNDRRGPLAYLAAGGNKVYKYVCLNWGSSEKAADFHAAQKNNCLFAFLFVLEKGAQQGKSALSMVRCV